MSFVGSNVFRSFLFDMLGNGTAYMLDAAGTEDLPKVALYTTTPDNVTARDDTFAHNAYNGSGGQWVTANQPASSGNWPQAGVALAAGSTVSTGSGFVMYDAADVAPGGTSTLAGVFGCLVYDDTITTPTADPGLCCNYFGGSQSVTGGTFSVIWNANGIFRFTV
jgi:hypothetical protein